MKEEQDIDPRHRTRELLAYLLSDEVREDSTEFLPQQAAIDVLQTTAPTIKHRIETGELREKTFFLLEPVRKTFLGVEIGGIKRLLLKKMMQRTLISQEVERISQSKTVTSYGDLLDAADMNWQTPPDRKFCNKVLSEISHASYEETVDSGHPCLKSAVVVSRSDRLPTNPFYDLAVELGLLTPNPTRDEKIAFWEHQLALVYEKYGA